MQYNPDGADYYEGDFGCVDITFNKEYESYCKAFKKEVNWLNSECNNNFE